MQLLEIPFLSEDWVIACLPIDPSSLICSLASVSSFLGTLYKDYALPDLSACAEQSRNFEQLPCIAFQPPKIVLHNCQTSLESVGKPRTQSPFCPSAAKVMKQAEEQLISTENKRGPFCVIQVLSQTSCTSTSGYKRLGLSHTIHTPG